MNVNAETRARAWNEMQEELEFLRERLAAYEVVRVQLTERGDKYLRELVDSDKQRTEFRDLASGHFERIGELERELAEARGAPDSAKSELANALTLLADEQDSHHETRRELAEAKDAARTWENEAERRSRRYEKCAVELAEARELLREAHGELADLDAQVATELGEGTVCDDLLARMRAAIDATASPAPGPAE